MKPEECLAKARELALTMSPAETREICAAWDNKRWPEPEVVAWILAHMLAQTMPAASAGYKRRAPIGPVPPS